MKINSRCANSKAYIFSIVKREIVYFVIYTKANLLIGLPLDAHAQLHNKKVSSHISYVNVYAVRLLDGCYRPTFGGLFVFPRSTRDDRPRALTANMRAR